MTTSFNTTATFFCLQGGRCREVQLYLMGFETEHRHAVMQVFILGNVRSLQNYILLWLKTPENIKLCTLCIKS